MLFVCVLYGSCVGCCLTRFYALRRGIAVGFLWTVLFLGLVAVDFEVFVVGIGFGLLISWLDCFLWVLCYSCIC